MGIPCAIATWLTVFVVCKGAPTLSNDCEVTYREAGHILTGTAQGVLTAEDVDHCISLCSNSYARFSFHCTSGVFFYHTSEDNCILNSHSKRSRPDLYTADPAEKVEYFEVHCASHAIAKRQTSRNRNVLQLQTPEFGNWTMCDRQLLQHMRFKQCQSLNPNKCEKNENACDPAKEDEYDREGGSSTGATPGATPPPPTPVGTPETTTMPTAPETSSVISVETSTSMVSIAQNRRPAPANTRLPDVRRFKKPVPAGATSPIPHSKKGTTPQAPPTSPKREEKKIEIFNGQVIKSVKTQKQNRKSGELQMTKTERGFYRLQNETKTVEKSASRAR